jgi:hypothetical protein
VRNFAIVVSVLVVLGSAAIDNEGLGVVPGWVYLAANAALLAAILKRCTIRRMAFAVVVLALTIRLTYSGMSSLGHRVTSVRPGMTVEEARHRMTGFREGSGLISPYTGQEFVASGTLIFKDPTASPSDQTWGVIVISNGRVSEAYLSPD